MKKRNMKMTSVVLAAALAAVSLAGCGGSGKTETTAAAGSADTTAAETGSEAESSRRGSKGRWLQGSHDL